MNKLSAGLIMYHYFNSNLEVLLVHPGGPYWAKKDDGAWSIPKGEYTENEDPLVVAKREFKEETSYDAVGDFILLTPRKQPSGKIISAWAFDGDCNADTIQSNTFSIEWPPKSGKQVEFPEVDRAAWFSVAMAKKKLLKGHIGFIDELCQILGYKSLIENENEDIKPPVKTKKSIQPSLFD